MNTGPFKLTERGILHATNETVFHFLTGHPSRFKDSITLMKNPCHILYFSHVLQS